MSDLNELIDFAFTAHSLLREYERALEEASKRYDFKIDDFLYSLKPLPEDAVSHAFKQVKHALHELEDRLEDYRRQEQVLLEANEGLIKQRDALRRGNSALQQQLKTLQLRRAVLQDEDPTPPTHGQNQK